MANSTMKFDYLAIRMSSGKREGTTICLNGTRTPDDACLLLPVSEIAVENCKLDFFPFKPNRASYGLVSEFHFVQVWQKIKTIGTKTQLENQTERDSVKSGIRTMFAAEWNHIAMHEKLAHFFLLHFLRKQIYLFLLLSIGITKLYTINEIYY